MTSTSLPPAQPPLPPRPTAVSAESMDWSDPVTRQGLQMIAEGLTQLAGFTVAAVSVVRDDGHLEVMAVAGSDAARDALHGTAAPLADVLAELAEGEDWGWFKFVPQERRSAAGRLPEWVPVLASSGDPQEWLPRDLLVAPLPDADGVVRGLLSIDCPADGRRPDAAHRLTLDQYAAQAARALILALERQQLADRVRLLSAAREIVRTAAADNKADPDFRRVQADLIACFRARGIWVHRFDAGDAAVQRPDHPERRVPPELVALAEVAAVESWERQQVRLIGGHEVDAVARLSDAERTQARAAMAAAGVGTVLLAPLGAGPECLGSLCLVRGRHDPDWSSAEIDTALEVGRDLGRLLINARAFEREREAVRELRALDDYKNDLITTLSHELKSPLAAMLGNLELLEDRQAVEPDPEVQQVLSAVGRGATRLVRVVENLLLLARVGDPHRSPEAQPVDLAAILAEVRALSPLADQQRLQVRVKGGEPVRAYGDPAQLEILAGNLVGNALKYSSPDTAVTVTLARAGPVVRLTCSDRGIGIGEADRARLFEEFFRSDAGEVRREPGTGLGLAIVQRIVIGHEGRIDVDSELGVGTEVRVELPAAR